MRNPYPNRIYLEPPCTAPDDERRWSDQQFEMCSLDGCEHCNADAPLGAYNLAAISPTTEDAEKRKLVEAEHLRATLNDAVQAFRPFAKIMTVNEDGEREPFIAENFHDSDGVDLSWEPDQPFSPLTVGQFRRADAAYEKLIALGAPK